MSLVTVTVTNRVEVVESIEQKTLPAGAAIAAGNAVYPGTNGTWLLADAATNSSGVHLALRTAAVGEGLTAMKQGRIDGINVASLAQNAGVYLSATPGRLETAPSGTNSILIGRVSPANAQPLGTAPDKILSVNPPL
jgi:hypothetical protein